MLLHFAKIVFICYHYHDKMQQTKYKFIFPSLEAQNLRSECQPG